VGLKQMRAFQQHQQVSIRVLQNFVGSDIHTNEGT
jgi:hypothetical protein